MAIKISVMIVLGLAIGLFSIVAAVPGTAISYHHPYIPSQCYGPDPIPVLNAKAGSPIWTGIGTCGKKYLVKCTGPAKLGIPHPCTGKSVEVKIVGHCKLPKCNATFALSEEAFAKIATPKAGKIKISYTKVLV